MILFLNTTILALTVVSPLAALYTVSLIRKGQVAKHIKYQKILFWTCMAALVILETQIRLSGGSGSLIKNSSYYGTSTLNYTLFAHITGAVLTYIIWATTLILTNVKYKKSIDFKSNFAKKHHLLGKVTVIGLFYTAISAIPVYLMTFVL